MIKTIKRELFEECAEEIVREYVASDKTIACIYDKESPSLDKLKANNGVYLSFDPDHVVDIDEVATDVSDFEDSDYTNEVVPTLIYETYSEKDEEYLNVLCDIIITEGIPLKDMGQMGPKYEYGGLINMLIIED